MTTETATHYDPSRTYGYGDNAEADHKVEAIYDRELLALQNMAVAAVLAQDDISLEDNAGNMYPDPDRCKTLEELRDMCDRHGLDYPEPDPWAMNADELRAVLETTPVKAELLRTGTVDELRAEMIDAMNDDEAITGLGDWREHIRANASPQDVFQWWLVTSDLARDLDTIGEVVLSDDESSWWGRGCCGQGVCQDATLYEVLAARERRYKDTTGHWAE